MTRQRKAHPIIGILHSRLAFKGASILFLFSASWMLMRYPLMPGVMAIGLLAYGVLLWKYPAIWLFVVPAVLPILDPAPWTGWFFFDEFDMLLLVTVGVRFWRLKEDDAMVLPTSAMRWTMGLFGVSLCVSTILGLYPFPPVDLNSFSNYFSEYNAVRVGKGFAWAALSVPLLQRDLLDAQAIERFFIPGMITGLSGAGIAVLWERQVFSGLFYFNSDFRVVGSFSGMHTGGAYIDAYFAAALPFSAGCFLLWRKRIVHIIGAGVFCLGLYSLLVTFSRVDYFAFGVSFLIIILGLVSSVPSLRRLLALGVVTCAVGTVIVWFVLSGTFIQSRFSSTADDAVRRIQHWRHAIGMMDPDTVTQFFGMGLGAYPRTYAVRSTENEAPSTYWYRKDDTENSYLSLPSGGFLYMDQRIALKPNTQYVLSMDLRSESLKAELTSPVCEKSLLHSFNCQWITERLRTTGKWEYHEKRFNSGDVGKGDFFYQRRPVCLSLLNAKGGTVVDVDNIRLIDESGKALIQNGDFSQGSDYWFFTADNHLPWHIKNIWVHLFFEHGAVGLCAFTVLLFISMTDLARPAFSGDLISLLFLSSLGGLLTVGIVDSLFDFPRITLFFFLLIAIVRIRSIGGTGSKSEFYFLKPEAGD